MNKTWVIVVLIILVALVAYNFNGMTGAATGVTTITVSPNEVSFGKQETMKLLQIHVKPSANGIDTKLHLYRVAENGDYRVGTEAVDLCTDSICKKEATVEYKLGREIEVGKYFFRGERANVKFDSNTFEVTSVEA